MPAVDVFTENIRINIQRIGDTYHVLVSVSAQWEGGVREGRHTTGAGTSHSFTLKEGGYRVVYLLDERGSVITARTVLIKKGIPEIG